MADISNEIATIQVATNGSALRSAIVDALEAINISQSWVADDTPTEDSDNLVKSGGIYSAIQAIKKKTLVSSITLSSSWLGDNPYYQTVLISGTSENSKIDVQPDAIAFQQLLDDGVLSLWVENHNGTFVAYTIGAKPTVALTIQCTITDADFAVQYYSGSYILTPSTASQVLSVSGYQMSSDFLIESYPVTPLYSGAYLITPSTASQVLSVSGYQMSSDFTVEAFPVVPMYTGSYDIVPSTSSMILNVSGYQMASNIIIESAPEVTPLYTGAYTITPSSVSQIINVSGYKMSSNLTIESYPVVPMYIGSYIVIPSTVSKILNVSGYQMSSNLVIQSYPSALEYPGDYIIYPSIYDKTISVNGYKMSSDLIIKSYSYYPSYNGSYSVYPSDTTQVLNTYGKILWSNITVYSINAAVSWPELINKTLLSINDTQGLVSYVGKYAFYEQSLLSDVNLPYCMSIDDYAFYGCTSLENAWYAYKLPRALFIPIIGTCAFMDCSSLWATGGEFIKTIKQSAFKNCISLDEVYLNTVETIESNAFEYCIRLRDISFNSLNTLSDYAFMSCYNLSTIYLMGSSVCNLESSTAFESTPIGGYLGGYSSLSDERGIKGGTRGVSENELIGIIYVPESLYSDYMSANDWSYFSSRISAYIPGPVTIS